MSFLTYIVSGSHYDYTSLDTNLLPLPSMGKKKVKPPVVRQSFLWMAALVALSANMAIGASFKAQVTLPVLTDLKVVDDGDSEFAANGGLTINHNKAYKGDFTYIVDTSNAGTRKATWQFNNVPPATYNVYATWVAYGTNNPSTIYSPVSFQNGVSTPLNQLTANQQITPADGTFDGVAWKKIGTIVVNGNTVIIATSAVNAFTVLDGMALQRATVTSGASSASTGGGVGVFGDPFQDGPASLPSGGGIAGNGPVATPPTYCGDGILQTQNGEQCDDANKKSGDNCSPQCKIEFCGDSVITVSRGEECDSTAANCNNCKWLYCGDGILSNALGEECDDSNVRRGDGCSDTCQRETTASSSAASTGPTATLTITEKDIGAAANVTKNQQGIVFKRFEVRAGPNNDVILNTIDFPFEYGVNELSDKPALMVDTNGDSIVDTFRDRATLSNGTRMTFGGMTNVIPRGTSVIYEIQGTIPNNERSTFSVGSPLDFVAYEGSVGSTPPLAGLQRNGICPSAPCSKILTTITPKVFTVVSSSASSTPVISSSSSRSSSSQIIIIDPPLSSSSSRMSSSSSSSRNSSIATVSSNPPSSSSVAALAPMTITDKDIGAKELVLPNQKAVLLKRFEVRMSPSMSAQITLMHFKTENSGLTSNAHNYVMTMDTNGDGIMDSLFNQKEVADGPNTISFTNNYTFLPGKTYIFELRADIIPSAQNISLGFSFMKEISYPVTVLSTLSGQPISSQVVINTLPAKIVTVTQQGSLFVSPSATPVRQRQLIAGSLSDELLRLQMRTEREAVGLSTVRFTVKGNGAASVDHLQLFLVGNTTPLGYAQKIKCPAGSTPDMFCIVLSNPLILPKGATTELSVRAQIKSAAQGVTTGQELGISLLSTGSKSAVEGRGQTTQNTLEMNNGDTDDTGEVFIGRNDAGENHDIDSMAHTIVVQKIVTIVDAAVAANGSPVPKGVAAIGQFRFGSSAYFGTSGPRLTDLVFTINARNVDFNPDGFKIYNRADNPIKKTPCALVTEGSTAELFYVACYDIAHDGVSTEIRPGNTNVYVLEADITNPSTALFSSSSLQVSLDSFNKASVNGLPDGTAAALSHLRWIDTSAGLTNAKVFWWMDLNESIIKSTQFGG